MEPEIVNAIKGSIRHWEENIEAARNGVRLATGQCALCKAVDGRCHLCPLDLIGKGCLKKDRAIKLSSPYGKVYGIRHGNNDRARVKACEKMLAVLKSLLPEGEK